jgi:hypothetical protein
VASLCGEIIGETLHADHVTIIDGCDGKSVGLGNTARKKRGSRCRADKFGKLHFIPPECHTGKYNTEFFSRVNIILTRVNK